MRRQHNKVTEREEAVFEGLAHGKSYSAVQDELGIKKGVMWAAMSNLVKAGRLRRVGKGKYAAAGEPPPPSQQADLPLTLPTAQVVKFPEPPPLVKSKGELLEEQAANLLGKVSELQPLLLLHKNLFDEIEAETLTLIERIGEVKSLLLQSAEEVQEYRELKAIKERAMQIAKTKQR